ncbi:MAG: FmdB family transcriptional regulator [Streptosporangiales bacterium]|nr:FmdB family transcriptional regulator [Streptosporangiales bacterium]
MPTYQYTCSDCGEPLEVVQRMTDDALTVCPACGGSLRKVFSPVGVVFKGSGFYRTDSREKSKVNGSAKPKDASKDTTKSAGDSSGGGSGSSEGSSKDSSSSTGSSSSSGSSGEGKGKAPAKAAATS